MDRGGVGSAAVWRRLLMTKSTAFSFFRVHLPSQLLSLCLVTDLIKVFRRVDNGAHKTVDKESPHPPLKVCSLPSVVLFRQCLERHQNMK